MGREQKRQRGTLSSLLVVQRLLAESGRGGREGGGSRGFCGVKEGVSSLFLFLFLAWEKESSLGLFLCLGLSFDLAPTERASVPLSGASIRWEKRGPELRKARARAALPRLGVDASSSF